MKKEYRVLDHFQSKDGHEVLTKRIYIEAGENFSYQKHFHRHEVWTIVSGTGLVVTNKTIREIKAGDVVQIPKNTLHSVKAITNLEFIEVQTGTKLIEEDIIYFVFLCHGMKLRATVGNRYYQM